MKLWTLMENTACRPGLQAEHGLSLYLETGSHRILFDAGQSGAFVDNAVRMGIDLGAVDLAILSHGHYDHGGGLARFLECNATAPVYLSCRAFGAHYNAENRYIGLDPTLQASGRLVFVDEELPLGDGLTLHACNRQFRSVPADSFGLTILQDGVQKPDEFLHELYLRIEEAGRTILVSGCSHKGILNITSWFRPDVLVGGFHFMKLDPREDAAVLTQAAHRLMEGSTVYYTGHCTGAAQFDCLKRIMGDRLHSLSTGCCIEI